MFDKGHILTDNYVKDLWLNRMLKELNPEFDGSETQEDWKRFKTKAHRGEMSRDDANRAFMQSQNFDDPAIDKYLQLKRANGWQDCPLFADTLHVLRELKRRGFRLHVVSDTDKSQHELRRDVGEASRYIDKVFVSSEFGKIKGEGLLEEVLDSERPAEAWFVCHDEDEAEASRRLGINTIVLEDGRELERVLQEVPGGPDD